MKLIAPMSRSARRSFLLLSIFVAIAAMASAAFAIEPGADGYYLTGSGVRVKKVALLSFDVYAVAHYMKGPSPGKNKRAIIDADVDKKFVWAMKRDVPQEKLAAAFKEGYANNGYGNQANIDTLISAFPAEIKDKAWVVISYDAANKKTVINVQGGKMVGVQGEEFMKATWSLWFGNIDQSSLTDALMSKL